MLPSRLIVASFKCSPTILLPSPPCRVGTASIPPSDRLRGRRRCDLFHGYGSGGRASRNGTAAAERKLIVDAETRARRLACQAR